ncbi:unnamed protein product [Rotaria sp. Silwood2]|nr:unnamed protein product [Rotaria sp. Silwood2]
MIHVNQYYQIIQHNIFYDRITTLTYESDEWTLTYRHNNVKELTFNDPYMNENIYEMPSVNYLRLNCTPPHVKYKHFSGISLPQIRKLSLPQYGKYKGKTNFYWWKLFPCVERLIISINSKKQIPFLIDHFKKMINVFFVIHNDYFDMYDRIKITSQWLKKNISRLKRKNEHEFVCQINNQFAFSLAL